MVDPVTLEVVRNALVAYADEMATVLVRSAYNMMISKCMTTAQA